MTSKSEKTPSTDRGLTGRFPAVVVGSGIDYFTATTPEDSIGQSWYQYYVDQAKQYDRKNLERDWSFFGYQGRKCDVFGWGYNPRWGYILQVSGPKAATAFLFAKLALNAPAKTTRIDLQVTIELKDTKQALASLAYQNVPLSEQNKRAYTYWTNKRGGQTLYVGKRTSSRYGRLYDKGAQMGLEPLTLWRYEVEYKKPLATQVAAALQEKVIERPYTDTGVVAHGLETEIVSEVGNFFTDRGVRFPLCPLDKVLVYSCGVTKKPEKVTAKLAWLRAQVAPTVQELMALGHKDDTLDALGIDPVFDDD